MIAGPAWTLHTAYSLLCSDYFILSANPPGLYFNATFSEKPDSAADSPYPSHSTWLFPSEWLSPLCICLHSSVCILSASSTM